MPNQPNLNFRPKPRYARPGRPNFGATARPGRPPYRGRVITDPRPQGKSGINSFYAGDKGGPNPVLPGGPGLKGPVRRPLRQKKVGGWEQVLRSMLKRRGGVRHKATRAVRHSIRDING